MVSLALSFGFLTLEFVSSLAHGFEFLTLNFFISLALDYISLSYHMILTSWILQNYAFYNTWRVSQYILQDIWIFLKFFQESIPSDFLFLLSHWYMAIQHSKTPWADAQHMQLVHLRSPRSPLPDLYPTLALDPIDSLSFWPQFLEIQFLKLILFIIFRLLNILPYSRFSEYFNPFFKDEL